jgi:[ribosomal protein S18]-alanine N-acetyltransferase
MRLPFSRPRDFSIARLTARDAPALERLHREDFSRPWSAAEFETLLLQPSVFGFAAVETGKLKNGAVGFVLARLAAGEAEILTVAVSRACRRLGLGRRLMDAVLRELHAQRAEALFLEVDETNAPAIALYRRLGFANVGRREGYYSSATGAKTGALVMRRDLG